MNAPRAPSGLHPLRKRAPHATRDPEKKFESRPLTVIYVMGPARAGSTILGVLLGNCDDIFYAGELDAWLRRGGVPVHTRADRTKFWRGVARGIGDYSSLHGDYCLRALEHSTAIFRRAYWFNRDLRKRYRAFNRELYFTVARSARARVVVDTSHYPLRARELRRAENLRLVLVYLTRDPNDIVRSFRTASEGDHKGVIAANAYLWLTHLLSVAIFLTHPRERRVAISYAEVVEAPVATARRVLRLAGAHSAPPAASELRTGRAFAGNRLLKEENVYLQAAGAQGAGRSLTLTSVLQWPWRRIFRALASRQQ